MSINLVKKLSVFLVAVFVFSGCASKVVSDVSVFHKLKPMTEKTIVIFEKYSSQEDSLEYDSYKNKILTYLNKNNYFEGNDANIIVKFDYGVGEPTQQFGSSPIYGTIGYSSYIRYNADGVGVLVRRPIHGVVGTDNYSYNVYDRFLTLNMIDKTTNKSIYEGKVVSTGGQNSILLVIDELIESLFFSFPGNSGTVTKVEVPYVE